MPLFRPTVYLQSVTDITPGLLQKYHISALVLDVDNTLTTHDHPIPSDGVLQWLDQMREAGIALLILSNNSEERVAPFAARLGLAFASKAKKPLPFGLRRACKQMGVPVKETAMVGDQFFTDVLCGNLAGSKIILLDPIQPEDGLSFRFKRQLERPLRYLYQKRKGRIE